MPWELQLCLYILIIGFAVVLITLAVRFVNTRRQRRIERDQQLFRAARREYFKQQFGKDKR